MHKAMGISQPCQTGREDKAKSWLWIYIDGYLAEGTDPAAKANTILAARWVRHNGQRTQQAQARLKQLVQSDEWSTKEKSPSILSTPHSQADRQEESYL